MNKVNDLHILLTFFFQIHYMDDFFAQNGSKCLLFYYEETPAPTAVEGDHSLASSSHNQCLKVLLILVFTGKQAKTSKRLYLTDGTKEAFPGLGMFFLRTTTKPITTANIAQETYFGILESNGGGLLEAIETLLTNVFIPALQQQTNWGTLSTDSSGHMLKEAFLAKLSSFVSVLANARASIADAVKLSPCSNPQLAALSSPSEILAAASNPELVEAAESCTQMWCKEIEQVPPQSLTVLPSLPPHALFILVWQILTQSEQMRKEADDVGPRAELEYWKKRMAKFDSLTTCVKSPQYRAIINVLVASKSKVLQVCVFMLFIPCKC